MAEMTDAELCEAAARAMGFRYWEVPVVVDYGTGETQNQPCYETPNGPLDPRHWNPLAVNADGEPTESAKAQLWDIEGWLLGRIPTLLTGQYMGMYRVELIDLHRTPLPGEEWAERRDRIARDADTLPRALLLAAVEVGEQCQK